MLRTHRSGKGPGGCGGWGLGSRNRRGPGVTPTPGLRGQGTSPGSPAGILGSSGRGNALLSSPAPPAGPLRLPLVISPASGAPSCLASTSPPPSVPLRPTGSLWASSRLLGRQSSPPAAGSLPSCGSTPTPCLPTPPS